MTMRRLLIGLLILGGVIAAIAVIRRRSGSGDDGWDSFAADDVYAQASKAATKATEAATDAASTATRAAKDTAVKAIDDVKEAAVKANEAAKDA
jgi:hypothetical protein